MCINYINKNIVFIVVKFLSGKYLVTGQITFLCLYPLLFVNATPSLFINNSVKYSIYVSRNVRIVSGTVKEGYCTTSDTIALADELCEGLALKAGTYFYLTANSENKDHNVCNTDPLHYNF